MFHVYSDVKQHVTTRGWHIVSIKAQTGCRKRRRVVKKKKLTKESGVGMVCCHSPFKHRPGPASWLLCTSAHQVVSCNDSVSPLGGSCDGHKVNIHPWTQLSAALRSVFFSLHTIGTKNHKFGRFIVWLDSKSPGSSNSRATITAWALKAAPRSHT